MVDSILTFFKQRKKHCTQFLNFNYPFKKILKNLINFLNKSAHAETPIIDIMLIVLNITLYYNCHINLTLTKKTKH